MNIYEKLSKVQEEIVARKNVRNEFGGFNYRTAEAILAAAKPICRKNDCVLFCYDTMHEVGGRRYLQAHAVLRDLKTEDSIEITALAREDEERPKMSASQLTGSASSYARKYALGGLFCLDDENQDPDSQSHKPVQNPKNEDGSFQDGPISAKDVKIIEGLAKASNSDIKAICEYYHIKTLSEMTKSQYADASMRLSPTDGSGKNVVRV